MNLHSKICLHTHPYVVVHLKSEKYKYLGTNGVYIRVDMEIISSMVYKKNVLGWLAPDARNAMT